MSEKKYMIKNIALRYPCKIFGNTNIEAIKLSLPILSSVQLCKFQSAFYQTMQSACSVLLSASSITKVANTLILIPIWAQTTESRHQSCRSFNPPTYTAALVKTCMKGK